MQKFLKTLVRKQTENNQYHKIITRTIIGFFTIILHYNNQVTVLASTIPIAATPPANTENELLLYESEGVLSPYGEDQFLSFIQRFYDKYSLAILDQNPAYLNDFIHDKFINEFTDTFDNWFIENKIIEQAQVSTRIDQFQVNTDNTINIDVLETIYLTNQDAGHLIRYKINLLWTINVLTVNNSFKIGIRDLKESIVAYESDGEWIKY
ncbi:hypothetical protein [Candidatus Epulonipiscium viviparus]|uniref:hypothetical protein n=1 Tax=Candidatus Epulonipiscium viviparus TaxID=420336 RepID=UPI00273810E7|nr:hypothetical protein [Candidatus Epulopiscium viviparus]